MTIKVHIGPQPFVLDQKVEIIALLSLRKLPSLLEIRFNVTFVVAEK